MWECFHLAYGVTEVEASSVFNNAAQKVIKDTSVEATDEAHVGERDLPDQGPAPSTNGRLVG
jgi:hypothetical protein